MLAGINCSQANSEKKPTLHNLRKWPHYSVLPHDVFCSLLNQKSCYIKFQAVGNLSAVAVARVVEWRWIGGGLVVARSRVLAVEWQWWSSGSQTSGSGSRMAVAVAVRAVARSI